MSLDKHGKTDREVRSTGHVYDGIEELDNGPPLWFNLLFYATVVFGLGYFLHYTVGEGPDLIAEYEAAKQAEEVAIYEHASKSPNKEATEDDLLALVKDTQRVAQGRSAYEAKCAACHGSQGQGGIGPNLTDPYWLHGGKMTQVLNTIQKGVPEKGMPPWGSVVSPAEAQSLVAYVRSIAGTQPAGAKAPQGEKQAD